MSARIKSNLIAAACLFLCASSFAAADDKKVDIAGDYRPEALRHGVFFPQQYRNPWLSIQRVQKPHTRPARPGKWATYHEAVFVQSCR